MSIRLEKYALLSPTLKERFSSDATTDLYNELEGKYGIRNRVTFTDCVSDVILGTYTTAQLPKLLETELSIDEATAQAIVEDLQEFLGPVYDRENGILPDDASYEEKALADAKPAATFEKATPTWEVTQSEPAATEPKPATPQPTPANTTTPAAPAATSEPSTVSEPEPTSKEPMAPMRTMKGDVQKIHGYGAYREQHPAGPANDTVVRSSQEETLTRRQPNLADIPKVDDDNT